MHRWLALHIKPALWDRLFVPVGLGGCSVLREANPSACLLFNVTTPTQAHLGWGEDTGIRAECILLGQTGSGVLCRASSVQLSPTVLLDQTFCKRMKPAIIELLVSLQT